MADDTTRPSWAPPAALVAQVKRGEVTDYPALMAWWQDPATPAWLRSMPADLAVLLADKGLPDPDRWRSIGAAARRHV